MLPNNSDEQKQMYKCKICDKQFDQLQTLALHEKHHQYKFQCGFCVRKLKTEREFLRHEATHVESTRNSYVHRTTEVKERDSPKQIIDSVPDNPTVLHSSRHSRPSSQQSRHSSSQSPQRSRPPSQQPSRPPSQQRSRPPSQQTDRPVTQPNKLNATQDGLKESSEDVFKKAAMYDEISKRCEELQREIEALEGRFDMDVKDNAASLVHNSPASKDDSYELSDSEVSHSNTNESKIVWEESNKTVPKSWKVGQSKDNRRVFKSPEGFLFETRVKALEFMINGNYSDSLICLMRNNLSEEGWITDRSCPRQWKIRKIVGPETDFEYLSPMMEIIPSVQDMLNFIRSQNGFDKKEIKRIEDKMIGLNPKRSERTDIEEGKKKVDSSRESVLESNSKTNEVVSKEGEILPLGWSMKQIGNNKVYLSPEGDIVHTIQQVLNNIETKKSGLVKDQSRELKPSVAEKRKFEELFEMNKKGKLDPQNLKQQKTEQFSEEQLQVLEESYSKSVIPSEEKIEDICNATDLGEREVKKWFLKRAEEQARSMFKERNQDLPKTDFRNQGNPPPSGSSNPHFPTKFFDDLQNLSDMHISSLNEIFKGKPYPTNENFKQISERLRIDRHIIVKWFKQKRLEKQNEAGSYKNNRSDSEASRHQIKVNKDKNNLSEEQEIALQATFARTKHPNHQDYKSLVVATGLSRLVIERWFNSQK